MIQQLILRNWRAYEHLELAFERPVTFVVAPNGVGKTSLMEAAKWAVFGSRSMPRRGRTVRVGAESAVVELDLSLGTIGRVHVSRTLATSGKETFRCSFEGRDLSENDYLETLSDAWAADSNLLSRLLFGEAGPTAETAFPIRDHLADVMGVTPMVRASTTIGERLSTLKRDITQLRDHGDIDSRALETARKESDRYASLLSEAELALGSAKADAESLEGVQRAAEEWQAFRVDLEAHQSRVANLVDRLMAFAEVNEELAQEAFKTAEGEASRIVENQREAQTEAKVGAAKSASAADLLRDEVAECPVCLRPLSTAERINALEIHEASGAELADAVHQLHTSLVDAEDRLARIGALSEEFRALSPPRPPNHPEPTEDSHAAAAQARQRLELATEQLGAARARALDWAARVEDLEDAAAESTALVAAYKEQAVLEVARDAFDSAAKSYITERIQPLVGEVSRRWKLLFGSEGLMLNPDGSLTFDVGEEDRLELADLSGGERVVALFVARLLIITSATRATMLWLDEPLEHLDMRRRAAIARTTVRAVQEQALGQLVATTYEEGIAYQLMATAPDLVQVAHVRAPTGWPGG